jgi:ABC-type transport system involved in multi-copper enzyme maturation permease subunit
MSGAFLLLRLSLKRAWLLLTATGVLLVVVQALRVGIAADFETAGQFDQLAALLPPFVRKMLGPSLASVMSFNGIVLGVYFDTGIMAALLALTIALATLPASEIETGFADLVLARSLARHWLITRAIVLVLVAILLMLLMIMAGTWIGLALFAPPGASGPPASQTGALALNLGLLLASWGGVAMAFGAVCRRGVASATTGLLALAALLLEAFQQYWTVLEWLDLLSPFHYFDPFHIVMGQPLALEKILVLWAIAMTGFALAYYLISQRDISR